MSGGRITRSQAANDNELFNEIEAFNPFSSRREIPRGGEQEVIPSTSAYSTDSLGSDTSDFEENSTIRELPSSTPRVNYRAPVGRQIRRMNGNQGNNAGQGNAGQGAAGAGNVDLAVPNFNITLKDALRIVPDFDGNKHNLGAFIEGCDEACELVGAANQANLIKLLKSKLTGEARKSIIGQTFNNLETFKDNLKTFFGPSKTVNQLLGEIGNEYQKEKDSVLAYASRIRELCKKTLDARRAQNGNDDFQQFKESLEASAAECFTRGLKPEIEQRLEDADDLTNLVKNAVKAEKSLEAQKSLRGIGKVEPSKAKREIYQCQICNKNNHTAEECYLRNGGVQGIKCQICSRIGHNAVSCPSKIKCQLCQNTGHTASTCRTTASNSNNAQITCQICDKRGHSANNCFKLNPKIVTCQVCQKTGHSANNCFKLNNNSTNRPTRNSILCQLCKREGHVAANCRNAAQSSATPTCYYCKKPGHYIKDCQQRIRDNRNSGNGGGVSKFPQSAEAPRQIQRSNHLIQADEEDCEIIPL